MCGHLVKEGTDITSQSTFIMEVITRGIPQQVRRVPSPHTEERVDNTVDEVLPVWQIT